MNRKVSPCTGAAAGAAAEEAVKEAADEAVKEAAEEAVKEAAEEAVKEAEEDAVKEAEEDAVKEAEEEAVKEAEEEAVEKAAPARGVACHRSSAQLTRPVPKWIWGILSSSSFRCMAQNVSVALP